MVKKKTFWTAIGVMLFTIGFLMLVNFALRHSSAPYAVFSGMLLIAWLWDDE